MDAKPLTQIVVDYIRQDSLGYDPTHSAMRDHIEAQGKNAVEAIAKGLRWVLHNGRMVGQFSNGAVLCSLLARIGGADARVALKHIVSVETTVGEFEIIRRAARRALDALDREGTS